MSKCPYCHSELQVVSNKSFCAYCEIEIAVKQRKVLLRSAVDYVDAFKSTKDLMDYHTFDLLLLLGFVRKERREAYSYLETINRVKSLPEFREAAKGAYEFYMDWTKKVRVVESLVKNRLGTVPKKITKELIEQYYIQFLEVSEQQPVA